MSRLKPLRLLETSGTKYPVTQDGVPEDLQDLPHRCEVLKTRQLKRIAIIQLCESVTYSPIFNSVSSSTCMKWNLSATEEFLSLAVPLQAGSTLFFFLFNVAILLHLRFSFHL
jgi:hypothetical protein